VFRYLTYNCLGGWQDDVSFLTLFQRCCFLRTHFVQSDEQIINSISLLQRLTFECLTASFFHVCSWQIQRNESLSWPYIWPLGSCKSFWCRSYVFHFYRMFKEQLHYIAWSSSVLSEEKSVVFFLSYSRYHPVFGDYLGILFWPKLLSCLFAAGVAQRFSLLYSGPSFMTFQSYTQRRTTVGRTSLDEGPARHRDLYLTTHTTLTTDKRPCPRWYSNPRSQQANGRRPTT